MMRLAHSWFSFRRITASWLFGRDDQMRLVLLATFLCVASRSPEEACADLSRAWSDVARKGLDYYAEADSKGIKIQISREVRSKASSDAVTAAAAQYRQFLEDFGNFDETCASSDAANHVQTAAKLCRRFFLLLFKPRSQARRLLEEGKVLDDGLAEFMSAATPWSLLLHSGWPVFPLAALVESELREDTRVSLAVYRLGWKEPSENCNEEQEAVRLAASLYVGEGRTVKLTHIIDFFHQEVGDVDLVGEEFITAVARAKPRHPGVCTAALGVAYAALADALQCHWRRPTSALTHQLIDIAVEKAQGGALRTFGEAADSFNALASSRWPLLPLLSRLQPRSAPASAGVLVSWSSREAELGGLNWAKNFAREVFSFHDFVLEEDVDCVLTFRLSPASALSAAPLSLSERSQRGTAGNEAHGNLGGSSAASSRTPQCSSSSGSGRSESARVQNLMETYGKPTSVPPSMTPRAETIFGRPDIPVERKLGPRPPSRAATCSRSSWKPAGRSTCPVSPTRRSGSPPAKNYLPPTEEFLRAYSMQQAAGGPSSSRPSTATTTSRPPRQLVYPTASACFGCIPVPAFAPRLRSPYLLPSDAGSDLSPAPRHFQERARTSKRQRRSANQEMPVEPSGADIFVYRSSLPTNFGGVLIFVDGEGSPADSLQEELLQSYPASIVVGPLPAGGDSVFFPVPYASTSFASRSVATPNSLLLPRPVNLEDRPGFAAYLVFKCYPHRERFFRLLDARGREAGLGPVETLSRCGDAGEIDRTSQRYAETYMDDAADLFRRFRFALVFENKIQTRYVTEKIVNAFVAGAVPIYWGSDFVAELFNPDAMIWVNSFESFEAAVEHVIRVALEPELYAAYASAPPIRNTSAGRWYFSWHRDAPPPDGEVPTLREELAAAAMKMHVAGLDGSLQAVERRPFDYAETFPS
ncbi:unnamed protein product [Symbiodinium necroappetens]|uniref:Fucosyltransferase n=1 Tax=Symbiodinium necroappetens TaxID=1628268 RepID=A0A813CHU3_9DINO|nr:unnamed protein product [Symbiodinium necroappetens]